MTEKYQETATVIVTYNPIGPITSLSSSMKPIGKYILDKQKQLYKQCSIMQILQMNNVLK